MNLPSQNSNTGRTLRAMHGAGPMTAGAIRRKANMHPDTEITARIRDIRKLGCIVACMKWIGERIQAVQEITEAQA